MWRAKNFSALSKHGKVDKDSHAAKRLGTKIGQAKNFYKVLDENDWSNLADKVDDILQNHGLNLVLPLVSWTNISYRMGLVTKT